MSDSEKPLQVEALTYSDSYETLVDRQFRGRPLHRVEDSGPYDVAGMVETFSKGILRSRQEYLPAPSGLTTTLGWASVCFKTDSDVLVTVMSKGSGAFRASRGEDEYKVTVTADSPQKAAQTLTKLRKDFLPKAEKHGPGFFIMTNARRSQHASLEPHHLLTEEQLALHYGEEFPSWCRDFTLGLGEPGISIFRGETGTGKTSFLRHVMCQLTETHRFYFVPVDNFSLLSSGALTGFWQVEQRDYPSALKVLVLEDAERLLMERSRQNESPVSMLLNLTDGLMTQFVKLHLLCTLNCRMEELDTALVRPGRLRFFRNFERMPYDRAKRFAEHYGFVLEHKADFSLAELFANENFHKNTAGLVRPRGPVGFSR